MEEREPGSATPDEPAHRPPDRSGDAERTPPTGLPQPGTGAPGSRPPAPPHSAGASPGAPVPPGPGTHPGQPAGSPPAPNPWQGPPAAPPGPPGPGASPTGGFLNQYQPMGSVQDGRDPGLHDRYWEAQLEAGARNSLHWGFLAFFVGWAAYYLVAGLIGAILAGQFQEFDPLAPPPMGPLLLVSLIPNLFLGLGPAVLSWWKGQGLRRDFGIVPKRRDWKVGLLSGGIGLVAAFVMAILLMSGSLDENGESSGINSLGQLAQGQAIWILLFSLFVFIGAPLTEELLVRGALWGALEQYRVPRYAILLLTTFVFALIHEEPERTPVLLVGGLAIGIARMITGRVAAAIIAHATYNLLPAVVFYAQFSG